MIQITATDLHGQNKNNDNDPGHSYDQSFGLMVIFYPS